MASISTILEEMNSNPKGVRFNDLKKICEHFFGKPRQNGSSHCIYKTPWIGNPRINIQNKRGKAKPYQVKQVLLAIAKIEIQDD